MAYQYRFYSFFSVSLFLLVTFLSSCTALKQNQSSNKKVVTFLKDDMIKENSTKAKTLPIEKQHDIVSIKNSRPEMDEKQYTKFLISHYSSIMNTPESYVKRNIEVYKFVDLWIGTPYKYAGMSQNGIDCSGFAKTFYSEVLKKEITRDGTSQFNECNEINTEDLQEGDLLFFKMGGRHISHVAVYLANNKFVHASTSRGVMISDLNEPYYHKHFFKAGRLKE